VSPSRKIGSMFGRAVKGTLNRPPDRRGTRRRSRQSGYAYIMAMFLMVAMIAGSEAVLQNIVTTGRRQRETETIWRGEQYTRAIRAYFRKTGHYPQTVDDLEKGQPELHFLRYAAYKNPMNPTDGSWRFIYVNAAGQIIGSVRFGSLQQMALMDMNGGQMPTAQQNPGIFGTPASSLASPLSAPGTSSLSPSGPSAPAPDGASQGASGPAASTDGAAQNAGANPPALGTPVAGQPQPTGPVDGPVLGAFLTGVAIPANIERGSLKVYKGAKKYGDWEFIWNPLEDQARAVQNGLSPQGAQPGGIGLPIAPVGGVPTPPANNPAGPGSQPAAPSPDQPSPPSPSP
jgi:hypothetical protein